MKNDKSNYEEIRIVSEDERRKMQQYIDAYDEKISKRNDFIKYVFYTPLSIATSVMSMLLKFCGIICSTIMPIALYYIYKIFIELNKGIALKDIKQTKFVCLLVVSPFIAFFMSFIFEKLSDYFKYYK